MSSPAGYDICRHLRVRFLGLNSCFKLVFGVHACMMKEASHLLPNRKTDSRFGALLWSARSFADAASAARRTEYPPKLHSIMGIDARLYLPFATALLLLLAPACASGSPESRLQIPFSHELEAEQDQPINYTYAHAW